MFLLQLGNQEDVRVLTMASEAFTAGLTLGLAALEAAGTDVGVEAAGTTGSRYASLLATASKAVRIADRVALGIGVAGILINDHRGLIIRTFGEDGRRGLEIWSKIETVTAIYQGGRGLVALGQLGVQMKSTLATWRQLRAAAKDLSVEEVQALDATIAEAGAALQKIDDAMKQQPPSGPAANENAAISSPAAGDNIELRPPPPPVAAQRPVMRMDDVNVVGQVANENAGEQALALASGDRPRASLGGGSPGGGGPRKPGAPPASPKAATPSAPGGPSKAVPPIIRRKGIAPSPPGVRDVPSLSLVEDEEKELSALEQAVRTRSRRSGTSRTPRTSWTKAS